jgi:hypothetical protein
MMRWAGLVLFHGFLGRSGTEWSEIGLTKFSCTLCEPCFHVFLVRGWSSIARGKTVHVLISDNLSKDDLISFSNVEIDTTAHHPPKVTRPSSTLCESQLLTLSDGLSDFRLVLDLLVGIASSQRSCW